MGFFDRLHPSRDKKVCTWKVIQQRIIDTRTGDELAEIPQDLTHIQFSYELEKDGKVKTHIFPAYRNQEFIDCYGVDKNGRPLRVYFVVDPNNSLR